MSKPPAKTPKRFGRKPRKPRPAPKRSGPVRWLLRILKSIAYVFVGYFGLCTVLLLLYNIMPPPTTGVHIQRRIESWFSEGKYTARYDPVSGDELSLHLKHAAVAAEDGRFYEHGGIDWEAIEEAVEDNKSRGKSRGGSTITQQLVKNLFMTTHSTYFRKALEVPLAYLAELLLSKDRILVLYLNVVEWGHGIYGAEAAAQKYYGISAARLSRYQAASLAACLPAPRRRTPQRMGWYTDIILRRMQQMNW